MQTASLRRIFVNAGVLVGLCLALATVCAYLLLGEVARAARFPLTIIGSVYAVLAGLALLAALGVLFRLHRVIAASMRHDILSLTRMFRDVRDGSLRENYPLALHEFSETLTYLRTSGRKLVREKQRLESWPNRSSLAAQQSSLLRAATCASVRRKQEQRSVVRAANRPRPFQIGERQAWP
jgi:hypothetical protein